MSNGRKRASFDWLALWILFSAWSSLSGWCLSALGSLNLPGIVFSYALFLGGVIVVRSHLWHEGRNWNVLHSRFLLPRLWLALAVIACVGGILYSPNNYDYLSYRFPRVLYWSSQHAWGWIPTMEARINYSAPGFEWLMAPLFILFKTDRLFFLINIVSYLLLPGLVFSVFSNLGISRKISWWWMWVLPCGYCYILQAGSVGNDSFAAVYFLASLHYIFRARVSSSVKNLALSCLAIALMTGAKASNLPLVLPWLTALFFYRATFLEKAKSPLLVIVLLVAAMVSFLPMALLNIYFAGDYSGDLNNEGKMKLTNPVAGLVGNSLQLAADNFVPPLLPRPINWQPLLPSSLKEMLLRDFPRLDLRSGELQIEEEAGLGLGIVLFAALFIAEGFWARIAGPSLVVRRDTRALWIVGAGLIALLAYMFKMGSESTSRLLAAYYPLLIAGILVLASLDGRMVRHATFKWIGGLAMLSALPLVILSPARPLFPVQFVSGILSRWHVPEPIIERYNNVYTVYAARSDVFKDLVAAIPPGERAIGFLQFGNAPQAPLWRPFGTRMVVDVTPDESKDEIAGRGIYFVVVSQKALALRYGLTVADLTTKWSASLVIEKNLILTIQNGPETWYLLRL